MNLDEIVKEIVIAMINKMPGPNVVKFDDVPGRLLYPNWIGDAYKVIYKAVCEAPKE
jgi:hypothetical protein